MHKNVKNYLVLCLICLQVVAPFIHAHAFGHDSFKKHEFHLHLEALDNVSSANDTVSQVHIAKSAIDGAIFTVASGIKTAVSDEESDTIAVVAAFFIFILLRFAIVTRFIKPINQVLNPQRYVYYPQSPRAPPL